MVRCTKCGMDNPDRSVFCVKCGIFLEKPTLRSRQGPKKQSPRWSTRYPSRKNPRQSRLPPRGRDRLIVGTVIGVIAALIFAVLLVALVRPTAKGGSPRPSCSHSTTTQRWTSRLITRTGTP